ncbi:unnamed protein product [Pleuronectes platessa]|uniref:Uncharacterized protein n=1 Tax=Pleuronectes platessa TaxID=8262 RepID=A0A9N7VEQ8_PLEPL|nr:unnamed protein product [Pleuronectes platessa]
MLTRDCLLLFLWILVNAGSVSSSRPPSPPLGRSRTGREHARGLVGPMRNGAAGYQRVKRGWVWNQFFVLEEYMGSDPQYVGKTGDNDWWRRESGAEEAAHRLKMEWGVREPVLKINKFVD